jgi:hypothetical protein
VSEISKGKIIDFRCLFYLEDTLATNPHNRNYKVQYSEETLATNFLAIERRETLTPRESVIINVDD